MSGNKDLVERLRRLDDWLAGSGTAADELQEAADEIVRLRAEVKGLTGEVDFTARQLLAEVAKAERLRAAGDALAELLQGYECLCWMRKCRCGHDAVLDAWREARRG